MNSFCDKLRRGATRAGRDLCDLPSKINANVRQRFRCYYTLAEAAQIVANTLPDKSWAVEHARMFEDNYTMAPAKYFAWHMLQTDPPVVYGTRGAAYRSVRYRDDAYEPVPSEPITITCDGASARHRLDFDECALKVGRAYWSNLRVHRRDLARYIETARRGR